MPHTTTQRPAASWLAGAIPAFGLIFGALWLLHLPMLRLPYFWDEAGYFIPAARDLLLTGDLIPHTTLSNAHPPLVMLWLALAWKLFGYSALVTRTAILMVAASGFTALWLLARRVAGPATATAAVLLTALSPTVFSQSAMAQLDIAAFALVLWMIYAHICSKRWQAVVFAALAAVAKETTVAITLTLAGTVLLGWVAERRWPELASKWCLSRPKLAQCAGYLAALLPLVGWYEYHFHRTGHVLGNPDYLRYNVGATVTPWRILIAAWMRLWHATGYMNLFVLTWPALLLWWSARNAEGSTTSHIRQQQLRSRVRGDECRSGCGRSADVGHPHEDKPRTPAMRSKILLFFGLVVMAQMAEFSVVGGALLARYMIPAIPLVILVSVHALRRHAPGWQWWIAGCSAAFVAALLFNPPWFISPEDNLTWTHFVRMHQHAAQYVEQHYADDRILTAWPASDELNRPFLGYVQQPLTVVRVENFTASEMLQAAQAPESFDVVVAFSTKYEPPRTWLPHIASWTRAQTRYFDFHQDLAAASIASLLHGRIVWQESSPGEWIAVIEIDKVRDARMTPPH